MKCPAWYSNAVSASERIHARMKRGRRLASEAFLASLVVIGTPVLAQSDLAQSRGLDWLQLQVAADGSLVSEGGSVATAVQARAEVIQTLIEAGRSAPPALLTSLQALPATDAEPGARKAVALRAAGPDITALQAQLIALQGSDGGVATHAHSGPTLLDTAWALRALSGDASKANNADLAASWLRLRQSAGGLWEAAPRSPLVTTAIALRALRDIAPRNPDAAAAASLAATLLISLRNAQGVWDTRPWVNAFVFEAVHDFLGSDPAPRTQVSDWLLAQQSADGSWGQDPFATALALRALRLATVAPSHPTQSALTLQVADSQTNASLADVAITLQGPTAATGSSDANGRIDIAGLAPGTYTATLALATYTQQLLGFALLADRGTDLGRIQLSRSTAASATTARLSGLVTDASTSTPMADATITVGTLPPKTSDAQGRYVFADLAPGSYTITVAKPGYINVGATVQALAGKEYDLSPSLQLASAAAGTSAQGCRVYGYVRRAADGAPIPGASVALGGANTASATTDIAGAYLIGSLLGGRTTVAVTAAGYDSVSGVTSLSCDVPNAYDFSPRLYATATSPSNANTASLGFVVVSAATGQPLPGVAVRATPIGQALRNLVTAADGRFTIDGLKVESVLIEIAATGYDAVAVSYAVEPLEAKDMGQLRLRPSGSDGLLPDLKLVSVKRGTAVTDAQRLTVSGAISVTVTNAGRASQPREARAIAFVDVGRDGRFDAAVDRQIGQATLTTLLQPAQSITLDIAVTGTLPFRDAPVHVWIDSEQVIAEINEANNIKSTADAAEVQPAIGTFKPKLKWHWSGSTIHPSYNQVMMAPVVGRIVDTNGDGRIDERDIPSVVFTTFAVAGTYNREGVIRVVNGATGVEQLAIRDTSAEVSGVGNLALADLDSDGKPEIIALKLDGGLVVFRNNGTKWWTTPPLHPWLSGSSWGAPFVADLDGDGKPEVVFGRYVHSFDGVRKWVAATSYIGGHLYIGYPIGPITLAADLDLNGTQSLIVGPSAHASDGRLLWSNSSVPDGFAAVGNFNADPYPEIVIVGAGKVSLLDHTGKLLWQVSQPGSQFGGPPTIADVDGDGVPEIGVANATRYTVFRADGSVLWSVNSQDASSYTTGSTVFDFDGDGRAEVLYGDEISIRAFAGPQGAVVWSIPNNTGTTHEYPLVVDLDNDGHADMVTIANDYARMPNSTILVHGVRVFQDENNSWVNTRSVWNQHAYSITNVNDDLTIPARPQPSWLAHNTYRANKRLDISATAVADATASYLRVRDGGGSTPSRITVRVGNGGALSTPTGLKVAFYNGASGNTVLGAAVTSRALAAGEYEDLGIDVSGSLAAIAVVRVVVDDDGTGKNAITDFDRNNNSVQADLSALAVALNIGVATDKPSYSELDTAVFTATVVNSGSFARDPQVRLTVETAAGTPVDILALPPSTNVAAGAEASQQQAWPTAGVLTGAYRVRAELIDAAGLVYASATAPFSVEASNTAHVGSRIATDRVVYSAAQTVQLRSRVFNTTANMPLDELSATTVLLDANGQEAWRRVEPIVQLAPQGSREYGYSVAAGSLSPGEYSATLTVRDALGGMRAFSSTRFAVVGTDYSCIGLRGALEVPASAVALGEQASIGWSVLNAGNTALNGVPLKLRIVDPVAGVLRGEYNLSATLAVGDTQAGAVNWQASGVPGDVVAVLAAVVNGREQVLAQATLKLIVSPVRIDLGVTASVARDTRVLVLVSCPAGNQGNDDGACVQQRVAAIDAMLNALQVPHRIVTSAAAFDSEFHCGTYNAYWISGGAIKLSNQLAKEVREAVRRGDGLIVDGVHDSRNQLLHPVAGVKQIGKLPGQDYGAIVAAGSEFEAGTLVTRGQPTRFQLTTGQPAAQFTNPANQSDPAIVVNRYGEGASVLLAFDLAAMMATAPTDAHLMSLVETALRSVASTPAPVSIGDVARLGTEVVNRGTHAVDLEVRATLPNGASFVDALPVPVEVIAPPPGGSTQVIWRATLPVGGSFGLLMRVRITAQQGVLDIPVAVYSLAANAAPQLQGSVTHSLGVSVASQVVDDAVAAIERLAPSRANDVAARSHALAAANQARQYLLLGNASAALAEWIKAADDIAGISSDDLATIAAAQLGVARAMEAANDRLCAP